MDLALGLLLAFLGWLSVRVVASAWHFRPWPALAIDIAAPALTFGFLLTATGRPIFAGIVTLTVFGGFAFADRTKRAVLQEPIVFSDMSEAVELVRHPQLYLPFAGTGRLLIGAAALLAAAGGLLWLEPAGPEHSLDFAAVILLVVVLVSVCLAGPLLEPTAALLRLLKPTGDLASDATALGPLAIQLIYGMIARAERTDRRAPLQHTAAPGLITRRNALPPVVVIQAESFFDARRLHPGILPGLLPHFDACQRQAIQCGRLGVPCWGANTIRSEFAMLTGRGEEELGYDRFNPYRALARAPLASLAWQMRARGYRTVCVHPFDRRFYRRDVVLGNLGFEVFLGEEAFPGAARHGLYIADVEIAKLCRTLLRSDGPAPFIFAITMENHGPWNLGPPREVKVDLAPGVPRAAQHAELLNLLAGLRGTDEMLGLVADELSLSSAPGLLALYGDHLPSLPLTFKEIGFRDTDTDYVVWTPSGGDGKRCDLPIQRLGAALSSTLDQLLQQPSFHAVAHEPPLPRRDEVRSI